MNHLNEIGLSNSLLSRLESLLSLDSFHRYSAFLILIRKLRYCILFPIFKIRNIAVRSGRMRGFIDAANSWAGSDALVLGSGPSLETLNLREAKSRVDSGLLKIVASNNYYQSSAARILIPQVYLLRDISFLADPKQQGVWSWLRGNPSVKIAVPHTWKKSLPEGISMERTFFFEDWVFPLFRRSYSLVGFRSFMGTSGVVSLALAVHFRPNKVLFLGLDLTHFLGLSENCDGVLKGGSTPYAEGVVQDHRDLSYNKKLGIVDALQASANQIYLLKRVFDRGPVQFVNLNENSVFGGFCARTARDKELTTT